MILWGMHQLAVKYSSLVQAAWSLLFHYTEWERLRWGWLCKATPSSMPDRNRWFDDLIWYWCLKIGNWVPNAGWCQILTVVCSSLYWRLKFPKFLILWKGQSIKQSLQSRLLVPTCKQNSINWRKSRNFEENVSWHNDYPITKSVIKISLSRLVSGNVTECHVISCNNLVAVYTMVQTG